VVELEPNITPAAAHYDPDYFEWQSSSGTIGGRLSAKAFRPYLEKSDCVLDFGCGGGFMLQALDVGRRLGVDVNPAALQAARDNGIEAFANLEDVPDMVADVVISNHALEHVEDPLSVLREMARKLKSGGRIVAIVPCDVASYPFMKHDRDFHLFSWSANNIANLVTCAGFKVEDARALRTAWPPGYVWIHNYFGMKVLELATRLFGSLPRKRGQVRVVARKL
jgi:SAM-dependent methyltransferase